MARLEKLKWQTSFNATSSYLSVFVKLTNVWTVDNRSIVPRSDSLLTVSLLHYFFQWSKEEMRIYILSFVLICSQSNISQFSMTYQRLNRWYCGFIAYFIFLLLANILQTYHQIYRHEEKLIVKCISKYKKKLVEKNIYR
jgi:hypothetical protein